MQRLDNKIAIVTGAAQGLGEAIARRLAAEGCSGITIADMNLEKAKAVAESLPTKGLAMRTDVTEESQVAAMVASTVKTFGRLDLLVSNAGILIAHDIADFPSEEWRKVLKVNLFAYFLCAEAAARVMVGQETGA